ncbi:hypothetical protein G6F40_013386 [Rhizopus arrhizus]|nr:hypothetical protein G6F40_013386 [Rhizopus arrhizus]
MYSRACSSLCTLRSPMKRTKPGSFNSASIGAASRSGSIARRRRRSLSMGCTRRPPAETPILPQRPAVAVAFDLLFSFPWRARTEPVQGRVDGLRRGVSRMDAATELTWTYLQRPLRSPSTRPTTDVMRTAPTTRGCAVRRSIEQRLDRRQPRTRPLLLARRIRHRVRTIALDLLGRDLLEEPARLQPHVLAELARQFAVAHPQLDLGAGDAHVQQAPLFLQVALVQADLVRQHAVLAADDEHVREFQALGSMHGHHPHLVAALVLVAARQQRQLSGQGGGGGGGAGSGWRGWCVGWVVVCWLRSLYVC